MYNRNPWTPSIASLTTVLVTGRRLNFEQMTTLEDYVDMFDKAAYTIESYQKLAGDFISPYVTGKP